MMLDESFVTATASVLFLALTFNYAKSFIFKLINDHINSVIDKQKKAEDILYESEILLKNEQASYNAAEQKYKEVLKSSEFEIAKLKQQAEINLTQLVEYKTKSTLRELQEDENNLLKNLRVNALNLAINNSLNIIKSKKDVKIFSQFNNKILRNLSH